MKLKDEFLTQDIDDVQFLVPTGTDSFFGLVRSNKTAAFIVDSLKQETTAEEILNKMCARYDAPRETIAEDVKRILDTLREINALEE